jgi:hypothetical protein
MRKYRVIKADKEIHYERYKVGDIIELPEHIASYYPNEIEPLEATKKSPEELVDEKGEKVKFEVEEELEETDDVEDEEEIEEIKPQKSTSKKGVK